MFWQPEFPACECAYQDHGKGDEPDHQRIGHVGGPTMEERSSQNMSWNGGRQMTRSRSERGERSRRPVWTRGMFVGNAQQGSCARASLRQGWGESPGAVMRDEIASGKCSRAQACKLVRARS